MKLKFVMVFLLVSFPYCDLFGEEPDKLFKPTITPYLKVQFWNVYSEGLQSPEETTGNRFASYFRRGRPGVKGNLLPNLSYDVMLTFDFLAKDGNLSTKGTANAGVIGVWSAYFTWKPNIENDWINLTGGFFLPHLSRESATSPWMTSSLDKSETSCYLRQFVTGKANGISPGINMGGLGKVGEQSVMYNVAIINRQDVISIQSENWSPVVLGHVMLNFGDAEYQKYKYTFSNNLLRKQTSATLGFGFSKQGKTDAFKSSATLGADATIYLGSLKLDGEYYSLFRKNESKYRGYCAMGRAGYNIFLEKNWVLEPTVMFEMFSGDDNYSDAAFFDGTDRMLDMGVNLISKARNIKLNLHYVSYDVDGTKNRSLKNDIKPGNYAVLGLQFTI